jgi:hypothetical protein
MDIRHEALLMLERRCAIFETAREISRILKRRRLRGAIIGGVSVALHGHLRTTDNVDVYLAEGSDLGRWDVPVRIIRTIDPLPERLVRILEITTISLADLISIKLSSGLNNILRSQDIADVIGLIRHHRLTGAFAPKIDKRFRADSRSC